MKRALILPKKKSHLPAVVKSLILFFKVEKQKAIIASGYFNPIYKGLLEYFNNVKTIAGKLFVIVIMIIKDPIKEVRSFRMKAERMIIVSNIKAVDKAILSIDKDRTLCVTIKMIAEQIGEEFDLGFANGGDQNNDTIPERGVCEEMNVALIDGLGDKIQSSSWLLKKL